MTTPENKTQKEKPKEETKAKKQWKPNLWEIKAIEKRINMRMETIESDIKTIYGELENLEQRIRIMELNYRMLKNDLDDLKIRIQTRGW
jgi:predicted RNase H-like nuclease (RuvC/YqgF family)